MSKTNDPRVTKSDLIEFYGRILPYLNGAAKSSFTPVGTVISVMGNHAPQNFLVCDGTAYNIADYTELAEYFEDEFGTKNYFGGDGTTTFAVPDLRGEFLRGTGTNSHQDQCDGDNVGTHQDGTTIPVGKGAQVNSSQFVFLPVAEVANADKKTGVVTNQTANNIGRNSDTSWASTVIARPANTSVLYCIAVKDLFADGGGFDPTVDNLVNYYLKRETYSKVEVDQLLAAVSGAHFEVVQVLPSQDIEENTIYLVPNASQAQQNVYDEYIYIDNAWELIGSTQIDLSNYVQKSQTVGLLKNDGTIDQNQYLTQHQDITGKADKPSSPTAGNFAALDSTGNLTDSGFDEDSFEDTDDVMSVADMDSVVTPLPLNPSSTYIPNTGFTPVGTVISVMGNAAPANYLVCDGTVYSIADYPVLAKFFKDQFGSEDYFGGDGLTTFAVPDLRGEFLRGTGTNSHTNQGSGADVGVHQDGTEHVDIVLQSGGLGQINYTNSATSEIATNKDTNLGRKGYTALSKSSTATGTASNGKYTARPTNTSVLYCIATKNIYIDAKYNYSTDETVVGQWIDGKPIYQKTSQFTLPAASGEYPLTFLPDVPFSTIDTLVDVNGWCNRNDGWHTLLNFTINGALAFGFDWHKANQKFAFVINTTYTASCAATLTFKYTKTTD